MRNFVLPTVLLALLAASAAAGEEKPAPPLRLELNLVDGSHVIGTPAIEEVPLQTPYAKMEIPLNEISAIKMGDDHETASVDLRNGDKVKGVIDLKPIELETVFGKVAVGSALVRELHVMQGGGTLPPGEGLLAFGGVNWTPLRRMSEVQGDKLVSLPTARPGFNYGHGGNGRGAWLLTNIDSAEWKDYSIEFELCMPGMQGGCILFHVVDFKESWNECGWSSYNLGVGSDGSWGLSCMYNVYCRVPSGYGDMRADGERPVANGNGLKIDPKNGNKFRIDVQGTRIRIRVDGVEIADIRDEKMGDTVGGKTLDHGGVGFSWTHDSTGWIRNFSARRL